MKNGAVWFNPFSMLFGDAEKVDLTSRGVEKMMIGRKYYIAP